MIIGRRSFVRTTALVGAASALAYLLSLSSIFLSHAAILRGALPTESDADAKNTNSVVFKIDGWNRRDGIAIDGSTTSSSGPAIDVAPDDQVWISINQSWQTAWL